MKEHLLIDGDIIIYKAAEASAEQMDFDDGLGVTKLYDIESAKKRTQKTVDELLADLRPSGEIFCMSCDEANFRLAIDPTYKGNRDSSKKPPILPELRAWAKEYFDAKQEYSLEADDVMGITSTLHPGKYVISSDDKDMRTIPGKLHIPRTSKRLLVSPSEADRWHLMQALMGDTTDGYKGCPGIGPKKAELYLDTVDRSDWWFAVVKTFECKGLTEEDALRQARLARILRASDYDFNKRTPILWNP